MASCWARERLYELVSAEPISTLAPKLNVSDASLKKACAEANIPVPGRVHWAKHRAGQTLAQVALPVRAAGMSEHVVLGGTHFFSWLKNLSAADRFRSRPRADAHAGRRTRPCCPALERRSRAAAPAVRYRNNGRRPFLVTLKPKHFPNRSTLGRFLDPFNVLESALGNGAPLDNKNNKKLISGNAPIVALEYWGASTWWTRHRVIDHTILTSIYTTKP